jgi:hypothetical protein
MSSAFHHDLGHLEIALRNAYDCALTSGDPKGRPHWVFEPARHFPPQFKRAANGRRYDANATSRRLIDSAVKDAHRGWRAPTVPPGKVIAELGFGFWRYLSSKRHHDDLWVPRLHTAFRTGTDRRAVDEPVRRLHDLRNRVAHHEPLLRNDLDARQHDLVTVAELLSEPLRDYLLTNSKSAALISERPR